ncbi:MAG TPA: hypothetical protein PKA27_11860 [Fimbriimonadaceae bacterium]|nr:hypothetical protein [Fimbriimonadaceae bacterium]
MKNNLIPVTIVGAALTLLMGGQAPQIEHAELKNMIVGLGYEVKDISTEPGKEKVEFKMKTDGFDVPIGAEVSPSKNYIWFTVNLGTFKPDRSAALIKQNQKIQPNFFYATDKDVLMMGIAVDNRGVNPATVKRVTDKLAADVDKTSKDWQ